MTTNPKTTDAPDDDQLDWDRGRDGDPEDFAALEEYELQTIADETGE